MITTERFYQLAYLEGPYMRSQPERLPHPQFVLRRYELVLHLAKRHLDYPFFLPLERIDRMAQQSASVAKKLLAGVFGKR